MFTPYSLVFKSFFEILRHPLAPMNLVFTIKSKSSKKNGKKQAIHREGIYMKTPQTNI